MGMSVSFGAGGTFPDASEAGGFTQRYAGGGPMPSNNGRTLWPNGKVPVTANT